MGDFQTYQDKKHTLKSPGYWNEIILLWDISREF